MRWLDSITNSMDMNLSKHQETVEQRGLACCSPWGHRELDTYYQLNNTGIYLSPPLYYHKIFDNITIRIIPEYSGGFPYFNLSLNFAIKSS